MEMEMETRRAAAEMGMKVVEMAMPEMETPEMAARAEEMEMRVEMATQVAGTETRRPGPRAAVAA